MNIMKENEMPGETVKLYRISEWQAQATGMKKELTSPINQEYGGVLHIACKISVEVKTAKPTKKGCNIPTWIKTLKFVLCFINLLSFINITKVARQILFSNKLASCTRCQLRDEILYNIYFQNHSRLVRFAFLKL